MSDDLTTRLRAADPSDDDTEEPLENVTAVLGALMAVREEKEADRG